MIKYSIYISNPDTIYRIKGGGVVIKQKTKNKCKIKLSRIIG